MGKLRPGGRGRRPRLWGGETWSGRRSARRGRRAPRWQRAPAPSCTGSGRGPPPLPWLSLRLGRPKVGAGLGERGSGGAQPRGAAPRAPAAQTGPSAGAWARERPAQRRWTRPGEDTDRASPEPGVPAPPAPPRRCDPCFAEQGALRRLGLEVSVRKSRPSRSPRPQLSLPPGEREPAPRGRSPPAGGLALCHPPWPRISEAGHVGVRL